MQVLGGYSNSYDDRLPALHPSVLTTWPQPPEVAKLFTDTAYVNGPTQKISDKRSSPSMIILHRTKLLSSHQTVAKHTIKPANISC